MDISEQVLEIPFDAEVQAAVADPLGECISAFARFRQQVVEAAGLLDGFVSDEQVVEAVRLAYLEASQSPRFMREHAALAVREVWTEANNFPDLAQESVDE